MIEIVLGIIMLIVLAGFMLSKCKINRKDDEENNLFASAQTKTSLIIWDF